MIQIDLQSRVPLYEQLQEQIIRLSMLGILDENQQLPSVRALAREVGVNPNTVAKAYQQLEQQGIIYTVSGKGQLCFTGCPFPAIAAAGSLAGGFGRCGQGVEPRRIPAAAARRHLPTAGLPFTLQPRRYPR